MPSEGHCGEGNKGAQLEPRARVGGLWDWGAESSRPQPQLPAFRSRSISWQRKKRLRDRRREDWWGGGTKEGDPGRGRGAMQMAGSTESLSH